MLLCEKLLSWKNSINELASLMESLQSQQDARDVGCEMGAKIAIEHVKL